MLTCFFETKRNINQYTWEVRWQGSLIDYISVNHKWDITLIDSNVYRGSETSTDNYLVISKNQIYARLYWLSGNIIQKEKDLI